MHGFFDGAIQILQGVLKRNPSSTFARLVRAEAYRFHTNAYFAHQASDDYTYVLGKDPSLERFCGTGFSSARHQEVDELLLYFKAVDVQPRPQETYPMFYKRNYLTFVGLVYVAMGTLRVRARQTKVRREIEAQEHEISKRRAKVQDKLRALEEARHKVIVPEDEAFEVWGPADPDNVLVDRYRRYWLERPRNFPKRSESSAPAPGWADIAIGRVSAPERGFSPRAPSADAPSKGKWSLRGFLDQSQGQRSPSAPKPIRPLKA